MSSQAENKADLKKRWGGFLEYPLVSRVQRNLLDAGRLAGLKAALEGLAYENSLDVGCGLGEGAAFKTATYTGLDNSFGRLRYARDHYPQCSFLLADARALPFRAGFFDLVMMIDTSHHLSDSELLACLRELKRITRKYLLVSDPVFFKNQSWLSLCAYQMDRGRCFRNTEQMKKIFEQLDNMSLFKSHAFRTFPGLYLHTTFILEKD